MSVQLDIQLADDCAESIEEPPPRNLLRDWAQAAWQGDANAEPILSLRIVSVAESQQLNNDYRNKNKPTNVLSFPMQLENGFVLPEMMLGDLVICAQVVADEAKQQQKTNTAHWAHMLVHGMLHLQGFDHIEDAQAEEMETLEIKIMQQLGFENPYLNISSKLENTSATESK